VLPTLIAATTITSDNDLVNVCNVHHKSSIRSKDAVEITPELGLLIDISQSSERWLSYKKPYMEFTRSYQDILVNDIRVFTLEIIKVSC